MSVSQLKPLIPSAVPKKVSNFRQVIPTADESDVTPSAVLYRSSKLDHLSTVETEWLLKEKGIRTIIDGRVQSTYQRDSHIDKYYNIQYARFPFLRWRYHEKENVKVGQIASTNQIQEDSTGSYYFVNFIRLNFYAYFFEIAPWYMVLFSIWLFIKDLWNKVPYFMNVVSFYESRWPSTLLDWYKNMVERSKASIAAVFKLLSQTDALPAVLTCQYGKDRTGLMVALILRLMGKSKEYIAWEYSLSQKYMDMNIDSFRQLCHKLSVSEDFIRAEEQTMLNLLDYIDERYGDVETYLEQCGFGREEQETLKRNITGKLKQS